MLLALVLCFDHRKGKSYASPLDLPAHKGHKYIWYALSGYAIGLVIALAAGILTHSPQPALLYLVCYLLVLVVIMLSPQKIWLNLYYSYMPRTYSIFQAHA